MSKQINIETNVSIKRTKQSQLLESRWDKQEFFFIPCARNKVSMPRPVRKQKTKEQRKYNPEYNPNLTESKYGEKRRATTKREKRKRIEGKRYRVRVARRREEHVGRDSAAPRA